MGNPVMQWQIVAKDPDSVASFYSKLFGWKVQARNALGYREISTGAGRGIDGGVWPAPPEASALVQLYIEVDDIDRHVEKAVTLGASVIVPKSVLPDGDAIAVIVDPAGLSFGLFEPGRNTSR